MASVNADAWVPEEYGSEVINRVLQQSAIEAVARHYAMGSTLVEVPRIGAATTVVVPKKGNYVDDANTLDSVEMRAVKFTNAMTIAEEDLEDSNADIIKAQQLSVATSYATHLDVACLGTTAVANPTGAATVPFTSVYKATGSGQKIASTAATYSNLSDTFALVEGGAYWNDADAVVIAHPKFKGVFRGILDSSNRPIFVEGLAGTPSTLFGYRVSWSYGAITSATASAAPGGAGGAAGAAGNPLLVVGNRQHLILGDRMPMEWRLYEEGDSARTDEPLLKMRTRKGFVVGRPEAFGILEVTKS
ncbi:phage major capsid protein [Streptomyces sp. NPDC005096]|uniref:phage major capsid protein n=1 Tax=Streptomyces sp. NPDC005096 TaxID=3154559 RepID=UPI0033A42085